uniref:Uncharacterized protein n=2 Tax=Anguilla anguilla TaxID=7936 RepID=A0A0E9TT32_ANGAN
MTTRTLDIMTSQRKMCPCGMFGTMQR